MESGVRWFANVCRNSENQSHPATGAGLLVRDIRSPSHEAVPLACGGYRKPSPAVKRIGPLQRVQRNRVASGEAVRGYPIAQPPNHIIAAAEAQMVLEVDVPDADPVLSTIGKQVALVKVGLQRDIRAIQ